MMFAKCLLNNLRNIHSLLCLLIVCIFQPLANLHLSMHPFWAALHSVLWHRPDSIDDGVRFAWPNSKCENIVTLVIEQMVNKAYREAQHLLLHAGALLEILDQVLALELAASHAVRLQAVHHVHLELGALAVRLVIDDATGHVGQRRTQERSQRHGCVDSSGAKETLVGIVFVCVSMCACDVNTRPDCCYVT